jgi:hypothetical protein
MEFNLWEVAGEELNGRWRHFMEKCRNCESPLDLAEQRGD